MKSKSNVPPPKRERAAPKKEFRMLRKGEIIREGDEVWAFGLGPWELSYGSVSERYEPGVIHHTHRREVKTRPASAKPAGRSRSKTRNSQATPNGKAPQAGKRGRT